MPGAVPLLLERMLSSSFPNWWAAKYHYNLFIFIIVLMGGLDGILRLERLLRRSAWARRARSRGTIVRTWAICTVALGVASIPLFSFGGLFTPRFYALSDRLRAAAQGTVEFEREGYLVLSRRARPPGGPSGPAAARTWARSG